MSIAIYTNHELWIERLTKRGFEQGVSERVLDASLAYIRGSAEFPHIAGNLVCRALITRVAGMGYRCHQPLTPAELALGMCSAEPRAAEARLLSELDTAHCAATKVSLHLANSVLGAYRIPTMLVRTPFGIETEDATYTDNPQLVRQMPRNVDDVIRDAETDRIARIGDIRSTRPEQQIEYGT